MLLGEAAVPGPVAALVSTSTGPSGKVPIPTNPLDPQEWVRILLSKNTPNQSYIPID